MRAAMYYANDDVRIVELPTPRIGPGEILVRVKASGICGSDVMEWYRKPKAPLVLGHEIAAEVVEDEGRLRLAVPLHDVGATDPRSEEHTSELQSRSDLVCRLLLEKKK